MRMRSFVTGALAFSAPPFVEACTYQTQRNTAKKKKKKKQKHSYYKISAGSKQSSIDVAAHGLTSYRCTHVLGTIIIHDYDINSQYWTRRWVSERDAAARLCCFAVLLHVTMQTSLLELIMWRSLARRLDPSQEYRCVLRAVPRLIM